MRHGERTLLLAALLAGALVGGCGEAPALDDSTTSCTPGRTKSCGCSDGAFGAQSCRDDGTYAACVCTAGGTGSGGTGSGGTGSGGFGSGGGAGGAGGGGAGAGGVGGSAGGGEGGSGGSAASLCPGGVLRGDASIRRAADLGALLGCTEITGYLDVNAADLGALSLPALTSVGSHLLLQRQRSLVAVELPALVSVGGTFRLDGDAGLTVLSLPALTSVGEFGIMADPGSTAALAGLSLPALVSVTGEFGVASTRLGGVELPRLTSVGGGFSWEANAELGSLSSPRLVSIGRSLRIGSNGALTSLSLPALTSVGGELNVTGNTSLPTCAAQAILDRLLAAGFSGSVFVSGNDDTGSCP